ncbi:hypothetical protein ELS19_17010 [Halogeometricum borinquense]|uniref:HVO-A0261-like N-terminal domain-containing protein n=1 Tax=Halogeometricum borinquense TaxID=60847 RepID=A0A482T0U6_9EURY|nr:hypothetical protein [Halogeometricum borinquense]RYJ08260.1 hypothetical protein ELS19_17010 [Halogeometricum borinquense]
MAHPRDVIKLLHDRYNVLQALEAHPSTKQEILPEVDVARSTLDTIMRQLETSGLVAYSDGEWHLTVYGHCACGRVAEFLPIKTVLERGGEGDI